MSQTTIIVIAVIVVVLALLLLYLLRGRKQHVTFDATSTPRAAAPAAPAPVAAPPIVTAPPVAPEGHDVTSEIAAAVEDVVDQFMGIEAHASGSAVLPKADALTQLKGLGPKAASRLAELGVTHLDQIASWNEADVAAIDAQMGAFKGRITRDKWVEQAKLLTAGDTEAFEAQFGKLGG